MAPSVICVQAGSGWRSRVLAQETYPQPGHRSNGGKEEKISKNQDTSRALPQVKGICERQLLNGLLSK